MNEMNLKNKTFVGSHSKPSLYDIEIVDSNSNSIVVFMHGYMGFKDWGCWNLVQEYFTESGYNFAKYNITHGGTTIENPTEFADLESFSINSYLREFEDCSLFIDHISKTHGIEKIHLIGHSRGGGMALLMHRRTEVNSITTWAAISTIEGRSNYGKESDIWKKDGIYYITNGRTNQEMPHSYSAYKEFYENRTILSIKENCSNITKPLCIIHGDKDTSINISEGQKISELTNQDLIVIPNTNHTFDSSHPWLEKAMPKALQKVCETTLSFIDNLD